MSFFPYKSHYSYDEIKNIFYPNLYKIIRGNNFVEPYSDSKYLELINHTLNNPFTAARFLYLIYGPPNVIYGGNKNKEIESALDLFSMSNSIAPADFKKWYSQPSPNVDIFLAIKRFLLDGSLYFDIKKGYLNDLTADILKSYSGKDYVLLLDGDNLYYHIGHLFKILGSNVYAISFFRRNNISPIYGGYLELYNRIYNLNDTKIATVESYGARKDAADVELTTAMAYLKINQNLKNIKVGKYYIVTGDEYANELVITSNEFFKIENYVLRLNSQLIDFTNYISRTMLSHWTINPADFPVNYFGELNPKILTERIKPNVSDTNNINFFINSNHPSTTNPINTNWLIDFIKSGIKLSDLPNNDYRLIIELLQQKNILSYRDFVNELNNFSSSDKLNLLEQYLVLIGTKYFTTKEIVRYFFADQYLFLDRIKLNYISGALIKISDPSIINYLVEIPIKNKDILNIFYNISHQKEAYIRHVDILNALSIKHVEVSNYDILHPENIIIKSFTLKV